MYHAFLISNIIIIVIVQHIKILYYIYCVTQLYVGLYSIMHEISNKQKIFVTFIIRQLMKQL